MRIVDGHCHVSEVWYEPVEALIGQMDRNGVAGAVLVQMLGQYDNRYQQSCLDRYPGRFSSVVAVDPAAPDALDALDALVAEGAAGLRLRPDARSPGRDPLAIWRAAEAAGLAVSCVGTSERFAATEFFDLLAAVPGLPIVLEHLGGTSRADPDEMITRRRVMAAADHPNVYIKVPGLGELVPRAEIEARSREVLPEIIQLALEKFGPERIMWASDFPVVCSREGYANALGWIRDALADQPPDALASIFCGTASRVFRLSQD